MEGKPPPERVEEARTALSAMDISSRPREALRLANVLFMAGLYGEALKVYMEVERHLKAPEVYNNIGLCLSRMGDLRRALKYYRRAIRMDRERYEPYFNMGKAYFRLGKRLRAAFYFWLSVRANPRNKSAWNNLGVSLASLGLFRAAAMCYRRAIEIDPDYLWSWQNLASVLCEMGLRDECMRIRDYISRVDPHFPHERE